MAEANFIKLPDPRLNDGSALTEILGQRRSVREFSSKALSLQDIAQLLWAAQGITSREGFRTAPSAGATYPLELYLVAGNVNGLAPGSFRYDPYHHRLQSMTRGDLRSDVARAALGQMWIQQAPAIVVVSAAYSRTTGKYGKRGIRYVHMEAGHAGQNLFLQAVASGLATVVVGAFNDDTLGSLLGLPKDEQPLSILPVGYSATR